MSFLEWVVAMTDRLTIKLTEENQERFSAIEAYAKLNGMEFGRTPAHLSRNKILNLVIENFYELFLKSENDSQHNYRKQLVKYLRVRDRKLDPNTQKLNRLDLITTHNLYMVLELYRALVLDQDKIDKMESMFVKNSPEFKMVKLLTNQIVQDKNRNFNLKNKSRSDQMK